LTRVLSHVDGDVFFPEWGDGFQKISEESFPSDEKNDFPTKFEIWVRKK
jgi:dihydrofolate reductase